MATRTVKARVELDGEKQYKQALAELNQGNKVLASEMKKLQAEYKGNAESTEFLTKKGDLLQRQLQQQKDKVEKLKEALQASAEKYGESSRQTQDWIIKLNNAEAAQFELEHAIEENNQALQGQDQQMVGLGDTVDGLASKLGINLPHGAKDALNGMEGLSAGSVAALGAIAAAVAVAIKAIKELHDMTLEAASDVDDLVTQSMISGIDTQTLQGYQYAAELIDVPLETLTGSLTKVTRAMASAKSGTGAAAEAFAQLGVSITDSNRNLRDSEDVFLDVVDALGQIENPTERDALAMEILGKSAQDLNPLILQGTDALRGLTEEAEENGYVLSTEQVEALAAVDDAFQRYSLTVDGVKKQLAADFAPASQAAMEAFAHAVQIAGKTLTESHIIENLAHVIQGIMGILDSGMSLFDNMPAWLNPLNMLSTALKGLAIILATVADAMKVVAGIMPWNWGSGMLKEGLGFGANPSNLQQVMGYGGSGTAVSYNNLNSNYGYDAATGRYYDLATGNYVNAAGTDYWRGGLTWVGENGPELVNLPRGSSIMSASESAGAAGAQYITINVQGIEQLDEVIRWYDSRRITERMR